MAGPNFTLPQLALYSANLKLSDSFNQKSTELFTIISPDTPIYIRDYFLIIEDLKHQMEETRKAYSDYSFVVAPIHKALESYLTGIFTKIFLFQVSQKNNESVGKHLVIPDDKKKEFIADVEKRLKGVIKLNEEEWIAAWNGLSREWKKNRNTLTHANTDDKVTTLQQAELAAGSIIRELSLTSKLIMDEFMSPITEYLKSKQSQK